MMNYYERYQPDVVLAYNDLAKEAEAFGCRVKYSDYVVPSIDAHVLHEDKSELARLVMPDPYKTARLPGFLEQCEALVKAKPPAAIGAVAVGPWTIAMLLRNPETMLLDTFEDPQFIHDVMRVATDFCKLWGDAIVEDRDRAQLLRADRLDQPDLPGQLSRVHRAVPQGAGRPLQGQEGRRDHAHLRHDLSDLRGPDQLRLHDRLLRPRPAGGPELYVDQLARFMEVAKGRAVAIGNVDATKFEKTTQARRWKRTCERCVDAAARQSAFILSTSCEIPPRSGPGDREVVHGRGPRVRPLRSDLR